MRMNKPIPYDFGHSTLEQKGPCPADQLQHYWEHASLVEAAKAGAWDNIMYYLAFFFDANHHLVVNDPMYGGLVSYEGYHHLAAQDQKTGNTFLHQAISSDASLEDLRYFLNWLADNNALETLLPPQTRQGKTVWHLVLEQKDAKDAVEKLNVLTDACHRAIAHHKNFGGSGKDLKGFSVGIQQADDQKNTPLQMVLFSESPDSALRIESLLFSGISIEIDEDSRQKILSESKDADLKASQDDHSLAQYRFNLLFLHAVSQSDQQQAEILIENGANINFSTKSQGQNAALIAAQYGQLSMLEWLVDTKKLEPDVGSIAALAVQYGHLHVYGWLERRFPSSLSAYQQPIDGHEPPADPIHNPLLLAAVRYGQLRMVQHLKPVMHGFADRGLLGLAIQYGHVDMLGGLYKLMEHFHENSDFWEFVCLSAIKYCQLPILRKCSCVRLIMPDESERFLRDSLAYSLSAVSARTHRPVLQYWFSHSYPLACDFANSRERGVVGISAAYGWSGILKYAVEEWGYSIAPYRYNGIKYDPLNIAIDYEAEDCAIFIFETRL